MKHSDIKLRELTTYEEHTNAIESIENDYLNVEGGLTAWNSGYETYLLKGAKYKIAKIEARMERLFNTTEEQEEEKPVKKERIRLSSGTIKEATTTPKKRNDVFFSFIEEEDSTTEEEKSCVIIEGKEEDSKGATSPYFPREDWDLTEEEVKSCVIIEGNEEEKEQQVMREYFGIAASQSIPLPTPSALKVIVHNTTGRSPIGTTNNPHEAMKLAAGYGYEVTAWEFADTLPEEEKKAGLRAAIKDIREDLKTCKDNEKTTLQNRLYGFIDSLKRIDPSYWVGEEEPTPADIRADAFKLEQEAEKLNIEAWKLTHRCSDSNREECYKQGATLANKADALTQDAHILRRDAEIKENLPNHFYINFTQSEISPNVLMVHEEHYDHSETVGIIRKLNPENTGSSINYIDNRFGTLIMCAGISVVDTQEAIKQFILQEQARRPTQPDSIMSVAV